MNYFRVHGALISGIHALPVQVECVQSRRLPYLQILGGGGSGVAELRERVIAAIESCRSSCNVRMPARRVTVQLQPGVHGLSLDQLDLPVALAILGSSGQIPAAPLERVIACGNLGLDGGLRPLGNVAALARLLREEHFSSAILPWNGSEVLEETGKGGGFPHLENVIAFLRGHGTAVRKPKSNPETQPPPPDRIWSRIEGQEVGKRLIEVAAAGLHHVLLPGPVSARADLLAHALSSLFPALNDSEAEEVRSIYALAGMETSCPSRPFFTFASSAGLPPLLADRRLAKVEEILLAHRGVLYVDQVCEKESLLFPAILPSMRYGKLQVRMGARRVEIPVSPLVVASGPVCGCGASGDSRRACTCRPTEVRRYRERWRKLLRQPFDLYLPIREERSRRAQVSWRECHDRVGEARLRMQSRQGKANGYLAEEELFGLHPWKEETLSLWRALDFRSGGESGRSLSLARVALTICDLRAGECVEPADFFEARHYQGDGYLEGEETGRRAATGSGIEPNSTAIP